MKRWYVPLIAALMSATVAVGCSSKSEKSQLEKTVAKQEEGIAIQVPLTPNDGDSKTEWTNPYEKSKDDRITECCKAYGECATGTDAFFIRCTGDTYREGCWKGKYGSLFSACMPSFEDCLDKAGADELDKEILVVAKKDANRERHILRELENAFLKSQEENKPAEACPSGYECLKQCPAGYFRRACSLKGSGGIGKTVEM